MTQVPLLVREKVHFYLHQHYQQRWSEQMKKVNEEYKNSVYERDIGWTGGGGITLFYSRNFVRFPHKIWSIDHRQKFYSEHIYIHSFVNNYTERKCITRPQKYYYSSGYNNPKGFCEKPVDFSKKVTFTIKPHFPLTNF